MGAAAAGSAEATGSPQDATYDALTPVHHQNHMYLEGGTMHHQSRYPNGATLPVDPHRYHAGMEGDLKVETAAFGACGCVPRAAYSTGGSCLVGGDGDAGNMAFVGAGKGDFIIEENYKYVGMGAGDVALVKPRRNWCFCCLAVLFATGLGGWLLWGLLTEPVARQSELPPLPFNCSDNFGIWSVAKNSWCCQSVGKGCPVIEEKPIFIHNEVNKGLDEREFETVARSIEPQWNKKEVKGAFRVADVNKDSSIEAREWVTFAESLKVSATFGAADVKDLAAKNSGVCKLWGDPHILTFDRGLPNFYANGEFWLVKSPKVHIQGRFLGTEYTAGLSCTNKIIIGGPFLQGHMIAVGTLQSGQKDLTVDGQPVLTSFPSSFTLGTLAELTYNGEGEIVDPNGEDRRWEKHIVHMRLPEGVYVTVYRWLNYIDVKIEMPPQATQDGICGNFNRDAADDQTASITERVGALVPSKELLFKRRAPFKMTDQQMELIRRCPDAKLELGKKICLKSMREDQLPDEAGVLTSCILDVCWGDNGHVLSLLKKLDLFKV